MRRKKKKKVTERRWRREKHEDCGGKRKKELTCERSEVFCRGFRREAMKRLQDIVIVGDFFRDN